MLTAILRYLRLIPADVDGAVSGLSKSLGHLEAIAAAKVAKSAKLQTQAAQAMDASAAAQSEADRAKRIHTAISGLIA